MGRTGTVWGYENLNVEPDVITSAKVRAVIVVMPVVKFVGTMVVVPVVVVVYAVAEQLFERMRQYLRSAERANVFDIFFSLIGRFVQVA